MLELLFVTKHVDSRLEHSVVETHTWEEALEVGKPEDIGVLVHLRGGEDFWVVLMNESDSLPQIGLFLVGGHFVEFRVVTQLRVLVKNVLVPHLLFVGFLAAL